VACRHNSNKMLCSEYLLQSSRVLGLYDQYTHHTAAMASIQYQNTINTRSSTSLVCMQPSACQYVAAWASSATLDLGLKAQAGRRSCRINTQSPDYVVNSAHLPLPSSWDGPHHSNLPHNLWPRLFIVYRLSSLTSIAFLTLSDRHTRSLLFCIAPQAPSQSRSPRTSATLRKWRLLVLPFPVPAIILPSLPIH
jgi:hypothetical protein